MAQGAYKFSGGLHGVGAKCVNALSDWFKVEVSRDGKVYYMAFERGVTTRKLEVIGDRTEAYRHADHVSAGCDDLQHHDRIQVSKSWPIVFVSLPFSILGLKSS